MQLAVEADDDIVLLPSEVLGSLEPALGAVAASMDLVLDLHARLRTTVTSRIERAMGFVDLHDDPNKRSKETFLSEDFQDKIEAKAKEKAHMARAIHLRDLFMASHLPSDKTVAGFSRSNRTVAVVAAVRTVAVCETVPTRTADSWALVCILTGGLLELGIYIMSLFGCLLPLRLWLRCYSVLGGMGGTVLVYAVRWPKYYRGARRAR